MKCGKCGAYISNGITSCTSCNTPISELEMKNMLIKENREEEVVNMPEDKPNDELTSSENTNINQFNMNTSNEDTIIDVASELPVIEDAPVVENIPEVSPVTEIQQMPVIEQTPVVEPIQEVAVNPVIEPTPVVEPTPMVEVTPVVEQTPVVEPTPVVESVPVMEPTPVVGTTPEVVVTPMVEQTPIVEPTQPTIEENKPFVESNTIINSMSTENATPVTPTMNTTSAEPIQTGASAPKKSNVGLIIAVVVAIVIVVGGIVGFLFLGKMNKPSYVFTKVIEQFQSGIVSSLKEKKQPVKADITIKPNFSISGQGTEEIAPILDLINKVSLTTSTYTNNESKEMLMDMDAKFNSKDLLALSYIVKDKKGYIKVKPVLDKYMESEVDEDLFKAKVNNDDLITIVNAVSEAYLAAAKE